MRAAHHTPFDYAAVDESPADDDSSAALHDSYSLLRSLLEFSCLPQNRNGVGLYHPAQIGKKVLVLLYAIDPTRLAVSSKEELLRRMSPSVSRRDCELIAAKFRSHLRANRALFAIGDAKAARRLSCRSKNETRAFSASARAFSSAPPPPGKESPCLSITSVVPMTAPRSRAAGGVGLSHATKRDGGLTLTFFDKLGMAA